jgi:hypothetical protein
VNQKVDEIHILEGVGERTGVTELPTDDDVLSDRGRRRDGRLPSNGSSDRREDLLDRSCTTRIAASRPTSVPPTSEINDSNRFSNFRGHASRG